jgi:hypothetical protein
MNPAIPSSTPNPDFSRFRPPDLNKIKHLHDILLVPDIHARPHSSKESCPEEYSQLVRHWDAPPAELAP